MSVEKLASGTPLSNRGVAEAEHWFIDRLGVSVFIDQLSDSDIDRNLHGYPDTLPVDFSSELRRSKNVGRAVQWSRYWMVGGPHGARGRIRVEYRTVGGLPSRSSLYCEFNPAGAHPAVRSDLAAFLNQCGSLSGAAVKVVHAAIDVPGRGWDYVVDDPRRKWRNEGALRRETQYVGRRGSPMFARLYDKAMERLEVASEIIPVPVARFEMEIRPEGSVRGVVIEEETDFSAMGRCEEQSEWWSMEARQIEPAVRREHLVTVPEDVSFASLSSWQYPSQATKLRRILRGRGDVDYAIALAVEGMGFRSVMSQVRKRRRQLQRIIEAYPVVDVAALWPDQWPSAVAEVFPASGIPVVAAA